MKIAVPKEITPGERRVALIPDAVAGLVKSGFEVLIERGAGEGAFFTDAAYETAGARVVDADALYGEADVVLKVQKPTLEEVDRLREGTVLVALPAGPREPGPRAAPRRAADHRASAWRACRASAARRRWTRCPRRRTSPATRPCCSPPSRCPKFFPMLMTAAGTVFAARVLVIGAGVAGLQAIATARRLGAQVWGYDIRPAVKEQVESLGAKFLEFDLGVADAEDKGGYAKAQSADAAPPAAGACWPSGRRTDVVITTALVPGPARAAPHHRGDGRRACGPAR